MPADGLKRAHLIRDIAEVLSVDAPLSQSWPRCCALVSSLMENDRVTIAVREPDGDRIACVFAGSVEIEPPDRSIRPDSMPGTVLASGETIVRAKSGGLSVGVPIAFGRTLYGAICLDRIAESDPERIALLESCALYMGAHLHHESTMASSERFAQLAFTDSLTGIANRRRFDEAFAREWPRAMRENVRLGLLMIDLDFFKSFNDSYGHQSGDLCLQRVAHALHDCVKRPADLVARYGGEEFVALLPGTDAAGATALAEEMRAAIAELAIPHEGSSLARVSLSIGVAGETPSPSVPPESLLQAADDALYRAKLDGRNRVYAQDYHAESEAARPRRTAARDNLPLALTRLIGRQDDIAQVRALLDEHRLVSIVGTGGTGKTRVAIAVASEAAPGFDDGAWFVDLSPISDKTLVASSIAAVFAADVPMDERAADALGAVLETKNALVVIDNCEHLVDEVAHLARTLLRHCPQLVVLTTSREPLGIAGEAVYRLPLLSMPAAGTEPTAAQAILYDAVALFVERAAEAKRDFALADDNVASVVAICRAVDGIALAIELAASRAATIGITKVAQRLSEFRLTAGGDRTALPRQRTMHATIGWSYDLLAPPERTLFCRLSVFAGNFTFEAVATVCAGAPVVDDEIFDAFYGLIRKSLVSDDPERDGRYRLLDSVRAFARERLQEAGDADRVARSHAEYFESLVRQADAMPRKTPAREWLAVLEPDVDNFRGALEWALDRRGDVVLGAAIAARTINLFGFMTSEATRWILKALDTLPKGVAPRVEALLCIGLATSSRNLTAGRLRTAGERAVELYRGLDDARGLSEALRGLAQIVGWYFREERPAADLLARESIAIAREIDDPEQLALSLRTRSLTLGADDFPAKRAVLEESLALIREHGTDGQIGGMLTWFSEAEFAAGNRERALHYGREAVQIAEGSGSSEMYTTATANLANYACAAGDWETVRGVAAETIRVSRKTAHHQSLTFAIQAFAALAAGLGRFEAAAQLIGFCDARCGSVHPQRQANSSDESLYRDVMASLERELGATEMARAFAYGAGLSESEAIALAEGL
jgi:diguanylate cyclase (GGDEF)-like protein